MKQCPNCKHNVPDSDSYCRYCSSYLGGRAQYRPTPQNANNYYQPYQGQQNSAPVFEYEPRPDRSNGAAVAGFVLSFFLPLLGLIFGCIGNAKANRGASGKGLSVAAIVLSVISLVFEIIVIVLLIYVNFYYVEEVEEIALALQRCF